MARSSWLDDEKTDRVYVFADGSSWRVQNEYRPIVCSCCGDEQYLRLTHIWHLNAQGKCVPEWHVNTANDLDALKALLVTYSDGAPVTEAVRSGTWVLMKSDAVLAEER